MMFIQDMYMKMSSTKWPHFCLGFNVAMRWCDGILYKNGWLRTWVRLYRNTHIVHGANMGPNWVLSAPDGPHVGPIYLAIRITSQSFTVTVSWCVGVLLADLLWPVLCGYQPIPPPAHLRDERRTEIQGQEEERGAASSLQHCWQRLQQHVAG